MHSGGQLLLAVISSTMTVYLTSSVNHESATAQMRTQSDSDPFKAPSENSPLVASPPPVKKKLMYFAAGSGIPEVKVGRANSDLSEAKLIVCCAADDFEWLRDTRLSGDFDVDHQICRTCPLRGLWAVTR